MKTFGIIGLLVLFVVACAVQLWQGVKISRFDRDFRQNLAGTWSRELGPMRCTYVVTRNGGFNCEAVFDHVTSTNIYQMTGTWLV